MSEFPNFNGVVTYRTGKTVGVNVITVTTEGQSWIQNDLKG